MRVTGTASSFTANSSPAVSWKEICRFDVNWKGSSMKLRKLVASIGAAVVGSAAIVAAGVSAASAATAPTGMTIIAAGDTTTVAQSTASSPETAQPVKVCLENAETQCADVKDSSNTANTRVWLYHNGNDDKWLKVLDTECIGAGLEDCYFLEDAENTSLCLSATGSF